MLFLITALIIPASIAFHKLVLMKAVNECPYLARVETSQTLKQAKSERDFALIRANLVI